MDNIELPKDADGREIPLDTALLYGKVSGEEYEVVCFNFRPIMRQWMVELKRRDDLGIYATESFTLSQPDSWEKLEEDLDRVVENKDAFYSTACAYMNQGGATCNDCRFHSHNTRSCTDEMFKDVVSRIRKLRGEDE